MPNFTRPAGVPPDATVDAYGNWFTPDGEYVATSNAAGPTAAQTQSMTDAAPQYDAAKKAFYVMRNGQRSYLSPVADQGLSAIPAGVGGGLAHDRAQWNADTGEWDSPWSPTKILSMVAAGTITAGAANAILAGAAGGGGAAAAPAAATTAAAPATAATATGATATGAGTAATAGGVAAPVVARAAGSSWLAPVLGQAIGGVTGLVGAKMQSNAARDAAALNDQYLREALDFEKEQAAYDRSRQAGLDEQERTRYSGRETRMAPYVQAGGNSADRQAQLLGLPARPSPTVPGGGAGGPSVAVAAGGAPSVARPAVQPLRDAGALPIVPGGAPAAGPATTVMLQAPDGSTKAVPAEQAEYWISKGARRVAA